MEGEVGAQVAPPVFLHHPHPTRFHETLARKRDFPLQNPNLHPAPTNNWNPNLWQWDSVRFSAKPSLDSESGQKSPEETIKAQTLVNNREEDGGNLTLKLGVVAEEAAAAAAAATVAAARPSKKVRSGSPGSGGGSYPMCQVDDCRADLTSAKDYHRRHKVCEVHSKTTKAFVCQQMQRFCQQCSRFHLLSEFDEGKRSCRRRLSGHNRRRRKTQPEDVSSKLQASGNRDIGINGSMDIVNLLAIFAKLQGNNAAKSTTILSLPDRDRLIQILGKINSLKDSAPKSCGFDLNVSQDAEHGSFEKPCKTNGHLLTASSTMDLLTVVSAALAASAPDFLASLSQASSYSSGDGKSKLPSVETTADANSHSKQPQIFSSVGGSPLQPSGHQVQEARQSLPLQLFGSAEDGSPPKLASSLKYFSSSSSNPMEDRSPSSSPPVAQKLSPPHSTARQHEPMSVCWEEAAIEASTSHGWTTPLDLFKESNRRVDNGVGHSSPYQAGYTSSCVSDHSPSSSNSDAQDRTSRITFKLFDKDPSKIPATLRTQIINWLSHSPSEMESYIRPGCVVLSLYVSMSSTAWDELEEDLLQRVTSLVQCSDSEFWRNGRFLVRTRRQLASHKDGKVRLCKSWKTWSAPELISVSPVAVVSGQETSLVLRGRNLTIPGTKIHCTYNGGYTSKQVLGSAYPGTMYDDSSMENFNLPGVSPDAFGRYFIEVENGFKGNSFPIIIADSAICQELRALDIELEEAGTRDSISENQIQDNRQLSSREDVLHFLNELGWLFQRKSSPTPYFVDFSSLRFKFLFTFSVERDWPCLIRVLLDMLTERSLKSDALAQESLEMLLEIQLLHRAVKRKCRKMVDFLLNYFVIRGEKADRASKMYLFPPNSIGPGGLTPLHLAASAQDSEDMIDALTNDPQEFGLDCWNSLQDDNGQSPYMYASLRNNHSYNELVARKIVDRKNSQVSIDVGNDEITMDKSWIEGRTAKQGSSRALEVRSCAECVHMERTHNKRFVRSRGLLARPYVHSMLAIAAVCVCVCLFFRGSPQIGSIAPFKWENLDFGPK
ncbi:squamosa promoter-binding-like protein 15 isoform X2 [Iris pallida]|uniref:Squamosa promoter-binding-like protein 15 isoform X2 n=1 Tax=Iris pallida TaxID=29817 RepID=A0AAX6GXQ2_IRIPA|nr:squamosa promoter-binding-like protein 15 isoform X2 [Iris pallida]